jgi:hypothetical protein
MNPYRLCKYSDIFFNEIYNSELQVMEMPVVPHMASDLSEHYRIVLGRDLAPQALRMLAVAEGAEEGDCIVSTRTMKIIAARKEIRKKAADRLRSMFQRNRRLMNNQSVIRAEHMLATAIMFERVLSEA